MFRLIDNFAPELIEIEVDGNSISVPARVSIAAALLYLDAIPIRTNLPGKSPRAPFCMMGICFECLVEVDGEVNQRACQIEIRAGMKIKRQMSANLGEADA